MTMANLQKLNPTQQELYNYLEQQTGQVNFEALQPFTTQEMGAVLHISRNTVSQYLNEFFKEGWMVKINTRPVYYFLRETLSRKFNVQTLDAEYEDLQFLQQDLNHGRRADSCFAGVIGYHLSLKSAVEKCRVAVEYPPTGLPLVLAGEKGTGKRLLAGKTWEYAKEKQVVPAESRFAELDCAMWSAAEPGGPCIYKRISGCGSGTEYMAVTPWGDLYPCHQFVGDPKYLMGDIWKGVTNTAVRDEFKHCNAYARKECQNCWAKLYCSGGCAANSYHATGNITGVYEYGCELFKKRMECAIMIKVAENQELAAKGIEVPIELGSTCNACADGEACE